MVLAFALGMLATVIRSDLDIPPALHTSLSLFLLLAIGLKGGMAIAQSASGTLLIPLGLGVLCTLIYRRARRLTSPLWVVWYGLLMSCLIWTQTSERFFEPSTLWYALLFALVHLYCQERAGETAVS